MVWNFKMMQACLRAGPYLLCTAYLNYLAAVGLCRLPCCFERTLNHSFNLKCLDRLAVYGLSPSQLLNRFSCCLDKVSSVVLARVFIHHRTLVEVYPLHSLARLFLLQLVLVFLARSSTVLYRVDELSTDSGAMLFLGVDRHRGTKVYLLASELFPPLRSRL